MAGRLFNHYLLAGDDVEAGNEGTDLCVGGIFIKTESLCCADGELRGDCGGFGSRHSGCYVFRHEVVSELRIGGA